MVLLNIAFQIRNCLYTILLFKQTVIIIGHKASIRLTEKAVPKLFWVRWVSFDIAAAADKGIQRLFDENIIESVSTITNIDFKTLIWPYIQCWCLKKLLTKSQVMWKKRDPRLSNCNVCKIIENFTKKQCISIQKYVCVYLFV